MIKCMLCGKELYFIAPTHLRFCKGNSDQLDTLGYKVRFPSAPLNSEERSQKISTTQTGRTYSPERCKAISSGKMGVKRRDGGVMLGKNHSVETREKISVSLKGRHQPQERIEKRRQSMQKYRGVNNPSKRPEVKKKISDNKKKVIAEGSVPNFPYFPQSKSPRGFKSGFRKDLGHFVRSGWEANVARVLKLLGRSYEYERQRFPLHKDGELVRSYLPDFFLENDIVLEVKGYGEYLTDYKEKLKMFQEEYPQYKVCVIETKQYYLFKEKFAQHISEWE